MTKVVMSKHKALSSKPSTTKKKKKYIKNTGRWVWGRKDVQVTLRHRGRSGCLSSLGFFFFWWYWALNLGPTPGATPLALSCDFFFFLF
jgi:hypothetical protein